MFVAEDSELDRRVRDETETHSPDQATFHQAATPSPSGPHSQHPWRCRNYDAIPSLCLSMHRGPRRQLQDPLVESPCQCLMAVGLSEVRDLLATLGSWMLDTPKTVAQGYRPCRSPRLSTVLGPAAAHAPPGAH